MTREDARIARCQEGLACWIAVRAPDEPDEVGHSGETKASGSCELKASLVYVKKSPVSKKKARAGGMCSCLILPRVGRREADPAG